MHSGLKFIPLALALGLAGKALAQQVVKIGHVGPVSGPNAHLGKDYEIASRMAIDVIR